MAAVSSASELAEAAANGAVVVDIRGEAEIVSVTVGCFKGRHNESPTRFHICTNLNTLLQFDITGKQPHRGRRGRPRVEA